MHSNLSCSATLRSNVLERASSKRPEKRERFERPSVVVTADGNYRVMRDGFILDGCTSTAYLAVTELLEASGDYYRATKNDRLNIALKYEVIVGYTEGNVVLMEREGWGPSFTTKTMDQAVAKAAFNIRALVCLAKAIGA